MALWWRQLCAIMLLSFLAGCTVAGYGLVEPGRTQIENEFAVSPNLAWSQLAYGERQIWTINGAGLEAIWFYAGLEDGEALIRDVREDDDAPRFRSAMRPNEVMELAVDSLGLNGAVNVEGRGLRPAAFGSLKGYRFELTYQTAQGLMMRGLAMGTVQDGKLQLIVYLAADLYYYDRYLDEVERIFASVEMIQDS